MITRSFLSKIVVCSALPLVLTGCPSGGVGDPCTPEDEYRKEFSGFAHTEVNVESRSFQCLTRVCLVNKFQGRVSCPYGQNYGEQDPEAPAAVSHSQKCFVPGHYGELTPVDGNNEPVQQIKTVVNPQLIARRAEQTVYCSCRCAGADPAANYCDCPSGFVCQELIQDLGLGSDQLAGSYCIRNGTNLTEGDPLSRESCQWLDGSNPGAPNDGEPDPNSLACGEITGPY